MRTVTSLAVASALSLVGCSGPDYNVVDLYPVFTFAPDRVDVGPVGPPLTGRGVLTISNAGKKTLEVSGDLLESTEFVLVDGAVDLSLAPDETAEVLVDFTPPTFRKYQTRLELETNDEERPRVSIPVLGEGVDLPFPDISIAPAQTVELDEIAPGEKGLFLFEMVNDGDADLIVDRIEIDGPAEFDGSWGLLGGTAAPGERLAGVVEYDPGGAEGDTALVTIHSNDPDEPETTVLLIGNGGGDLEFPVAVIDCPSDVLLTGPELLRLSGTGSYDPMGFEPLAYQWYVTQRPAASDGAQPIDPDDAAVADIRVDVAGHWQVMLLVTNSIGTASVPALCDFEAVPEDDLHVELSWDTPTSDVDLHLNLAGNAMFELPGVCNWCNKNENWGVSGADDDPRLDIDDLGGFGPENINVLHPADGGYDVAVHYFDAKSDGPTTATVKVWLDGALVADESQVLTNNQLWSVGQVTWGASPSFSLVDTVGGVGPRTDCF
jgi:hypothetical protein